MRILVLKRDKLGDLLLTTPLFAALREAFPGARIELLASEYNAWVAVGNPHLDAIHAYPRVRTGRHVSWRAVARQLRQFLALRQATYDWIIVAQGEDSPRAIQRALWLKAQRVIAYAAPNHGHGRRLTDALVPPIEGHEAQRLLDLLQPMGIHARLNQGPPCFILSETAKSEALQWLQAQGLAPQQYVVLGLGARRARKQPSTQQVLRWVDALASTYAMKTVFMWTPGASNNPLYPGDDAIAEPVLRAGHAHLVPFRGPLQPALGLIWGAKTNIFPDSGLMHFASASPGGVLGLFGDTAEFARKWAPLGAGSRYLVADTVEQLQDPAVFEQLHQLLQPAAAPKWPE